MLQQGRCSFEFPNQCNGKGLLDPHNTLLDHLTCYCFLFTEHTLAGRIEKIFPRRQKGPGWSLLIASHITF